MAKATITIEDNADGEATDICVRFDPPIDNRSGDIMANATEAQKIALRVGAMIHASSPSSEMSVNGQ